MSVVVAGTASLVTAPAGGRNGDFVSSGGGRISSDTALGIEANLTRKASEKVDAFSAAAVVPKAMFAPIHIKDRRMPESTRRRRLVTVTVNSLT